MHTTTRSIPTFLKRLPFLLVLCAFLLQPFAKSFSFFSEDISYEHIDIDTDDDSEGETEDSIDNDEKRTYDTTEITSVTTDLSLYHAHFYMQRSCRVYPVEIFIPPPETT